MQGLIADGGQGEAEVGWRPEDLVRGRESGCRTSMGLYRRQPLHVAASTDEGISRRVADESWRSNDIVISIFLTNVSMVGEPK